MAEVHYNFGPGSYRIDQLQDEIVAAGLPTPAYINGSGSTGPGTPSTSVDVVYAAPLTPGQVNTLGATVAAHLPAGPRRPRLIYDVYQDVGALTAAQKTAVWNDLSAGTPPKWAQDRGANAADNHILWMLATQLGAVQTQADKRLCQQMLISIYCTDNPNFLVHPPFDPSINI